VDNQTIIDRGNASAALLENHAFTTLFKELMDHYINTIVTSSPEQITMRETAYAGSRALQDIIGVMQQWIQMRDSLLEDKE
jgi:hypothetical protein